MCPVAAGLGRQLVGVLFFHHLSSKDYTQIITLGRKHTYLLISLASPNSSYISFAP